MSDFKEKLNNFFFLDEEEVVESVPNADPIETKSLNKQATSNSSSTPKIEDRVLKKSGGENVVAINQKQSIKKPEITIVEPRLYSEVNEIADHLLANQSVIINFRRMDHEQAKKIIDFLMGVTYAIKGDIQRLGEEIFICTPQSVAVNGSDLSEFTDSFM
jgi:cell division inhibitor SepF